MDRKSCSVHFSSSAWSKKNTFRLSCFIQPEAYFDRFVPGARDSPKIGLPRDLAEFISRDRDLCYGLYQQNFEKDDFRETASVAFTNAVNYAGPSRQSIVESGAGLGTVMDEQPTGESNTEPGTVVDEVDARPETSAGNREQARRQPSEPNQVAPPSSAAVDIAARAAADSNCQTNSDTVPGIHGNTNVEARAQDGAADREGGPQPSVVAASEKQVAINNATKDRLFTWITNQVRSRIGR